MTPPPSSAQPGRLAAAGGWLVTAGLAAVLAWTTLCLGGYRPETMVVSGPSVLLLGALGAGLFAVSPARLDAAFWLPVPFLGIALASVVWLAPAPWLAWREWLLWAQMAVVFTLVRLWVRSSLQVGVFAGTLALLGVVGAAMAAYQRHGDPTWLMLGRVQAEQFATRSAGMFGIPNSLAGFVELLLPCCVVVAVRRESGRAARLAGGLLAAVLGYALVLTGSRGGWISVAGVLLLWPLVGAASWRRRLAGAAAVALAVAGCGALVYLASEPVRERLQPFLAGQFEASRPIVWGVGWRLWSQHPWLGTGAASFNVLFEQLRPAGFLNEPQWAHNDYLNTLTDYGVLGFALWLAAGVGILRLGWGSVKAAGEAGAAAPSWIDRPVVRLGLWLGLVAFALHLVVDFHTKIPALAYAAAAVAGLLLRTEERATVSPLGRFGALALGAALAALAVGKALPLYRAEAARYGARQAIDKQAATGQGSRRDAVAAGMARFRAAVALDPGNGQAWSDLAYAVIQSWDVAGVPMAESGRRAEREADRAIAACPRVAEFWVRRGVALDMQGAREEATASFRRAGELAPRNPEWRYYEAFHWAAWPGHEAEARRATEHCLSLDPSYGPAIRLRERLQALPR